MTRLDQYRIFSFHWARRLIIRYPVLGMLGALFIGCIVVSTLSPLPPSNNVWSETPEQDITNVSLLVAEGSSETTSRRENQENTKDDGKASEPLFVEWPEPTGAIFISGRQTGYIEPCGCTGLANQKGGLLRRHTLQKELVARGWDLAMIDIGNQVRRYGKQPIIKMNRTYEVLTKVMGYDVVGFGPDDFRIGEVDLYTAMLESPDDPPFVMANVVIVEPESTRKSKVITTAGRKIGVTCVLGDEHLEKLKENGIVTQSARKGIATGLAELNAAACDVKILVAHTKLDQCKALAAEFPHFDFIVSPDCPGEPRMTLEEVTTRGHTTRIIEVGTKGMYVGIIGLFDGPTPFRFQRVSLDSRFEDSEQVKPIFKGYQDQLKVLGLEQLGLRPVTHPDGRRFAGSESCADCHLDEYVIWEEGIDGEGGPHFRATLDLVEPDERQRTWVTRQHDPECLSCHVTGWNPQEYYPYESGYLKWDDQLLHGNGCENCHGPGQRHVDIENGEIDVSEAELQKSRAEMVITLKEARESKCLECHDVDNSPDFHKPGAFEKYWKAIEHGGE